MRKSFVTALILVEQVAEIPVEASDKYRYIVSYVRLAALESAAFVRSEA